MWTEISEGEVVFGSWNIYWPPPPQIWSIQWRQLLSSCRSSLSSIYINRPGHNMTRGHALFTERRLGVWSRQRGCLKVWAAWRSDTKVRGDTLRKVTPVIVLTIQRGLRGCPLQAEITEGTFQCFQPQFYSCLLRKIYLIYVMCHDLTCSSVTHAHAWRNSGATLTCHLQRCVSADRFPEVVPSDTHVHTFIGFASSSVNNPEEEEGAARKEHTVGSRVLSVGLNSLAVLVPLHHRSRSALSFTVEGGRLAFGHDQIRRMFYDSRSCIF